MYDTIAVVAKRCLTPTLFLIGSGLSRSTLKSVGFRPMLQGILLWLVVSLAGLVAVRCLLP